MMDFKVSNGNFMDLAAGPMGVMFGIEIEEKKWLMIEIQDWMEPSSMWIMRMTYILKLVMWLTHLQLDVRGERNTLSFFTETQIPLSEKSMLRLHSDMKICLT